ncbi:pfEMP1, partial [Plasmodium falciparum HB3]
GDTVRRKRFVFRYSTRKKTKKTIRKEDWWALNRDQVWKAITCEAYGTYFRATCSDRNGSFSQAKDKCRCEKKGGGNVNIVPTYFDYVPQYLRWFEEWAEDFCRKKKKKLEKLDTQCRGKDKDGNEPRYCSRNGFDCEKTVNARGKVRMDNQRKQFLKQKERYEKEITGGASGSGAVGGVSSRQRRAARNENYKGYEKKFYDKLEKNKYGKVDDFLDLLSKEDVCKKITDEKEGTINFAEKHDDNNNDKTKGTFYRSKYCQPCPWCGMKKKLPDKEWEEKSPDHNCTRGKLYRPTSSATTTDITILKSGDGQTEIAEKLNKFCQKEYDESLYAAWKCYNDVEKVKNGEEEDDEEDVEE